LSKSEHVRGLLEAAGASGPKGPYHAYFYFFNRQQFYEAHDILESLWLGERKGGNNEFYKALIQLAGAFVHLQKGRVKPAVALFKLSGSYLEKYPARHEGLDVAAVLRLMDQWILRLETNPEQNRFDLSAVCLKLESCD
jgi:predicted metal-dependent hydrolase